MTREIRCTSCLSLYPLDGVPYKCPVCGGVFDYSSEIEYLPEKLEAKLPGIWKYKHTFGLPETAPVVSLGEGNTPLVWSEVYGERVGFKMEYLNPTGSFKDRGTSLLVSFLLQRGVREAVEDSSGNAGSSFAAYAARAGIHAKIFVPDYASGPKRKQIEAYGADVQRILGKRSDVAEAVQRVADNGTVYASHAYLPFGIPGFATVAYELLEQIGEPPGSIIMPVGQGGLLLGLARGFRALRRAGMIDREPALIGVQALACAPLWAIFTNGPAAMGWVTEQETLAEGVRTRYPLRGDAVLREVAHSNGRFVCVEEDQILPGRAELARRGFFVEPTSAIVWDGLMQIIDEIPRPIVAILTGSGFKFTD